MMGATSLSGRTALVTGGDGGVGGPLALALAKAGADLIIHHCGNEDGGRHVAEEARAMGRSATVHEADFQDKGAAEALARTVLCDGGRVDILVASAAIEHRRPWEDADADHVARHVAANFTSLLDLCRILVPPMGARGWGRVLAIGSILATRPRAETVVYAALKSAQLTAIAALARDVAPLGVTLNVLSPGAIRTDRNTRNYEDKAFHAAVVAKIPIGRPGTAEDLTGPALLLCSDAAGYVTGINLPVDGGWGIGDPSGSLPTPS
ncbi:MAG: SDR family oxidoreductase [Pseudomonadota bacterium]